MTAHHLGLAISFAMALVTRPQSTAAGIVAIDTAYHPLPSTLTIDLYLDGPPGSGVLLASAGPALVTGNGVLEVDLDASDTGTASLQSSQLRLDSFGPQTLDLGSILGTIDVRADQVELSASGVGSVVNSVMSTSSDTYLDFSIYSGSIAAFNPTGLIAALMAGLGSTEITEDFAANPIVQHLYTGSGGFPLGTLDDGPGLYSPLAEFNFAYSLDTQILFSAPTLWARIAIDFHFAAVPEPSSLALAFGAIICLGVFYVRRSEP